MGVVMLPQNLNDNQNPRYGLFDPFGNECLIDSSLERQEILRLLVLIVDVPRVPSGIDNKDWIFAVLD
jgi:hypothetical protein